MASLLNSTPNTPVNSTTNGTVTTIAPIIVNWFYTARFWLPFGSAAFILNILEAVAILKIRKYKSVFGLTLLSLCIADIFGGLSFAICGLLRLIESSGRETIYIVSNSKFKKSYQVGHAALFFSVSSSFFHVLIIAMQRLLAVFSPLKFKVLFTYKICAILLALTWLLSLALCVLAFYSVLILFFVTFYTTFIVCIVLVIIYAAICYQTMLTTKRRRAMAVNSADSDSMMKVIRVSLTVTIAFLVCTFLHPVYYLFVNGKIPNPMYHLVTSIIAVNPFLDPLIYFFFFHGAKIVRENVTRRSFSKVGKEAVVN